MDLTIEHFSSANNQFIHLFLEGTDISGLVLRVKDAAVALGFHLATLEGEGIGDQDRLLVALARAYQFPTESGPDYALLNWNGASDWMSDLTWLTGWPRERDVIKGFLLLYTQPMVLFSEDPVEFALFLSVMVDVAQSFQKENLPFHFVIGPLSYKALEFIQLLKASEHVCASFHRDKP